MPNLDLNASSDDQLPVQLAYMTYQLCKLLYLECLVAGTVMYSMGLRTRRYFAITFTAAVAYAVISVLFGHTLNAVVVWQSPLAVAGYAYCAWSLLRLPPSRRSLGSEITGTIFGSVGRDVGALRRRLRTDGDARLAREPAHRGRPQQLLRGHPRARSSSASAWW